MSDAPDDAFATYRALLAKVDAKFAEVRAKHPAAFACGSGCHGCCQPGLSVNRVERDHIAAFLAAHPERAAQAAANAAADPWRGTRCAFLDPQGRCLIYEARPVVCRSHGAPTIVPEGDRMQRDVCPLNFAGQDLQALPDTDFIRLETLSTILAVVNIRHQGDDAGERFTLSPDLAPADYRS